MMCYKVEVTPGDFFFNEVVTLLLKDSSNKEAAQYLLEIIDEGYVSKIEALSIFREAMFSTYFRN